MVEWELIGALQMPKGSLADVLGRTEWIEDELDHVSKA
jgi:hypothetical protein